jgi:hypothetical protein
MFDLDRVPLLGYTELYTVSVIFIQLNHCTLRARRNHFEYDRKHYINLTLKTYQTSYCNVTVLCETGSKVES